MTKKQQAKPGPEPRTKPEQRAAALCPRRDDMMCAPLNDVLILGGADLASDGYSACSCGKRFSLTQSSQRRLTNLAAGYRPIVRQNSGSESWILDSILQEMTWPPNSSNALARQGVVPVGTAVLHSSTDAVKVISKGLIRFGHHLISTMERARGIGLAANQVGVPLRVLAHNLERVAPQVLINPEILQAKGKWFYEEGCLSLQVDGTWAEVRRPRVVTVVAVLLDGRIIVVRADELLGRVLQHEIDHLDGIEYVQRLEGDIQEEVYEKIAGQGIDLSCMPVRPYERRW